MEIDYSSLLIRKLPSCLRSQDRESLLKFFGAIEVNIMLPKGQMKNCAFAKFASPMDAKMALSKLHQLNVFGSHLIVVYAHKQNVGSVEDRIECDTSSSCKESSKDQKLTTGLTYKYPPPTQSIISNIANCIASVPELYTQVLHLMNKMNLPPPFGLPLPAPTLPAAGGDSESEIESDSENIRSGQKRSRVSKHRKIHFKHIKESLTLPAAKRLKETNDLRQNRKINIVTPSNVSSSSVDSTVVENVYTISATVKPVTVQETPAASNDSREEEAENINEEFIMYSELQLNHATDEEMLEYTAFKNYIVGEISMRLYIKNLSKQVTEKDLRYIYGRYINWESELHKNSFDVRVMQRGRMKGQAFVGLPNEDIASVALKETHGFKLYDRPMVVQFARSTKAKEVLELIQ